MKLVQIFLPRYDNRGRSLPATLFGLERQKLVQRFGGVTAYAQAPAVGLWKDGPRTKRDEIVIYEVMANRYSRRWWKDHRRELERFFRQKEIMIRVTAVATV